MCSFIVINFILRFNQHLSELDGLSSFCWPRLTQRLLWGVLRPRLWSCTCSRLWAILTEQGQLDGVVLVGRHGSDGVRGVEHVVLLETYRELWVSAARRSPDVPRWPSPAAGASSDSWSDSWDEGPGSPSFWSTHTDGWSTGPWSAREATECLQVKGHSITTLWMVWNPPCWPSESGFHTHTAGLIDI